MRLNQAVKNKEVLKSINLEKKNYVKPSDHFIPYFRDLVCHEIP